MKYVWNKMKVFKNRVNTQEWNNWKKEERVKVIREEVEKLARPWVEESDRQEDKEEEETEKGKKQEQTNNTNRIDGVFTKEEFERALRRCKEKSSLGLDGIEYKMIKGLSDKFKIELLKLYNYAYEKNYMFKDWKENQTIFIDKGKKKEGQADYDVELCA